MTQCIHTQLWKQQLVGSPPLGYLQPQRTVVRAGIVRSFSQWTLTILNWYCFSHEKIIFIISQPTFLNGFIVDCIWNSYLQSSHLLVSELLIHFCRQAWCTQARDPEHKQGEINGISVSASQWHILQISRQEDATETQESERFWLSFSPFSESCVFEFWLSVFGFEFYQGNCRSNQFRG